MSKRILIAPLDWGLGHATRCVPIIKALQEQGNHVVIASSGLALNLLKAEFPQLTFFDLPAYRATYSTRIPLLLKILWQSPYIFTVIKKEHQLLDKLVEDFGIDIVISDNRYGCYSKKAKSIFITHQLEIQLPQSLRWAKTLINKVHHRLIKKFDTCWVPDFPDHKLSGNLSRGNLPSVFIGPVSRFLKSETPIKKNRDLLILLSGPEPQRTALEDILLHQLKTFTGSVLLVRGLPGVETRSIDSNPNIQVVSHLNALDLQCAIELSEVVLSRSGYTSIMDLYALESKAIFIPTPGQTEQEYLAEKLEQAKVAFCVEQHEFNLQEALTQMKHYHGFQKSQSGRQYLLEAIRMMA